MRQGVRDIARGMKLDEAWVLCWKGCIMKNPTWDVSSCQLSILVLKDKNTIIVNKEPLVKFLHNKFFGAVNISFKICL